MALSGPSDPLWPRVQARLDLGFQGLLGCRSRMVFARSLQPLVTENPVRPPSARPGLLEKPGGLPGGGITALWAPSGAFSVSSCGLSHAADPARPLVFFARPLASLRTETRSTLPSESPQPTPASPPGCVQGLVATSSSPARPVLGPALGAPSLPHPHSVPWKPGARLDSEVLV